MDAFEVIKKRISCRAFSGEDIEREKIEKLIACIERINEKAGLHFQIYTGLTKDESVVKLAKTMFDGKVYWYAALVGGEDELSAEKVGYYGEELVLLATSLGLGTCWVGGTFDKNSVTPDIGLGEKLWDVIPIGYPAKKTPIKQRLIRDGLRKKTPAPEKMVEGDTEYKDLPEWVKAGLQAILDGPSAVNRLPIHLVCEKNNYFLKIYKENGGFEWNDLGIAKYQFWYAANALDVHGEWEWGSGGEFQIKAQQIEDLYQ